MTDILLHTQTQKNIANYMRTPAHGLLLTGTAGTGKYYVAIYLADKLNMPSLTIEPEENKKTISITQIRSLYSQTKTGNGLCIIIKDAERMGLEAQNAFLKLLEEPPQNTRFILTVSKPELILPTIKSRCQLIQVMRPSTQQIIDYMGNDFKFSQAELAGLIQTTNSQIGTLFQLLNSEDDLQKHKSILAEAKTFYAADAYDRHLLAIKNKFEAEWIQSLLSALALIVEILLKTNVAQANIRTKLIAQSNIIEQTAYNLFVISGNPKIQLTNLIQQL